MKLLPHINRFGPLSVLKHGQKHMKTRCVGRRGCKAWGAGQNWGPGCHTSRVPATRDFGYRRPGRRHTHISSFAPPKESVVPRFLGCGGMSVQGGQSAAPSAVPGSSFWGGPCRNEVLLERALASSRREPAACQDRRLMGDLWIGQCTQSWFCALARGLLGIPKITARARDQWAHLLGSTWAGRCGHRAGLDMQCWR